jgi:D-3-phosphoglycerate dehydrogenase / 2-oxoglutarate reductase
MNTDPGNSPDYIWLLLTESVAKEISSVLEISVFSKEYETGLLQYRCGRGIYVGDLMVKLNSRETLIMKKVLIPTKLDEVAKNLLEQSGEYQVVAVGNEDLEGLARENPDAYAVIVRSNKVTKDIIDMLPELKIVVRAGAGYNTIDTAYARERGVDVMNTPGANANAVAEEVICLMLADARHVVKADPSVRSGKWEKKNFKGREITDKTIGLIGVGAIGALVAKRVQGFDMRVLGFDPKREADEIRGMGIEPMPIDELLPLCDYVSLHVPENDKTRGMVDKQFLGKMKDGATLINCARAGVVDEDALREMKAAKGLRFLNDVYPADAEGAKSVADIADVMMPHLGASTDEANFNAAKRAAEQIIELARSGSSPYIVN